MPSSTTLLVRAKLTWETEKGCSVFNLPQLSSRNKYTWPETTVNPANILKDWMPIYGSVLHKK